VKTVKFKDPKYLGDPINIVKIFNDKEVDELIFLDIAATLENKKPPFGILSQIASECFMPLCYGGGIQNLEDMKSLFRLGIEKIAINTQAIEDPHFITVAADNFGSQAVIVSIDVKKDWLGRYQVYTHGGRKATNLDPVKCAVDMEKAGAGELLLNSIDRDGTMQGYDLELLQSVSRAVNIPIIACGGAGKTQDFAAAIKQGGASAVAAGSMFVFQGPHRAVLISYVATNEVEKILRDFPGKEK
jgi:cyclase